MHPRPRMNIARTSLLRHDVEALDVSDDIVRVHWAEYESELHDNVTYLHVLVVHSKIQARNPYLRYLGVASRYQSRDW